MRILLTCIIATFCWVYVILTHILYIFRLQEEEGAAVNGRDEPSPGTHLGLDSN